MPSALDDVLLRLDIWRGDRLATLAAEAVASGFAQMDAELPGGGWPRGALVELLPETRGLGEVAVLLPALRQCVAEDLPVALVAPPGLAHAPAWAASFPLAQLLVVEAAQDDIAWSVELLLASGGVGAVLAWLPAKISNKSLRRLQLAAEGKRSLAFMFRPPSCAQASSPAPLRLSLRGSRQGLQVDIFKRRGPPCEKTLLLQVERPLPWARVRSEPPRVTQAQRKPQLAVVMK
ncbi:translesion DNA synthesis-associated protein ImuA [Uliginosibacterium sp. H3]|uniref:Translesion DNA synthesis-associated protein ImuA n=1 Tax=Uliginosibacterium silvisoli TaxID=3114758 RepID=A0ABU6KA40_9RHOO|nr:translesion DNA synthesis-associated protein ImuA [Uliginosibacterium sp. H3]